MDELKTKWDLKKRDFQQLNIYWHMEPIKSLPFACTVDVAETFSPNQCCHDCPRRQIVQHYCNKFICPQQRPLFSSLTIKWIVDCQGVTNASVWQPIPHPREAFCTAYPAPHHHITKHTTLPKSPLNPCVRSPNLTGGLMGMFDYATNATQSGWLQLPVCSSMFVFSSTAIGGLMREQEESVDLWLQIIYEFCYEHSLCTLM